MSLVWTEQMSVGNEMIDSGNKILVGMINEATRALKDNDHAALLRAFEQLGSRILVRFRNEETVAQAVGLPFEQHQRIHRYLEKEFQYLRDELESKEGMYSEGAAEHFTRSLENWLIEHLTREDMQMKPTLQKHPYDFKPT